MNSSQRRKDIRKWKHSVKVTARTYDQYNDMWMWLKARHGTNVHRCGWRDRFVELWDVEIGDEVYDIRWQFLKQKDAVEFALRWAQ